MQRTDVRKLHLLRKRANRRVSYLRHGAARLLVMLIVEKQRAIKAELELEALRRCMTCSTN